MGKPSYYQLRLKTLRAKLADMPCDTLWITQPENRRYLSGFKAEDSQFNESSGSLLISASRQVLVTDSRYTLEAQREAGGFQVVTIKRGLPESLPETIQDLGTEVLGFEENHVTWGLHRNLSRKLRRLSKPVRLVPIKGVVEKMREVKDPHEIAAMRKSASLMSDILNEVIKGIEPGQREREVAFRIECLAREAGADGLAFPSIVASGPNGALPHAVPSNRKLRPKEPIIIDVGLKFNGYCCDMTRTVFLDTPRKKFREIYRVVRQAQLSALAVIRPGVESTHPDSVARGIIRDAGYGDFFGHSLGHGVGLATHEGPRLGPEKPVMLKEGMVVTVEPGIYIPGLGGVRLEEMVVVGRRGPRILTVNDQFYDF
ncbi:MAG: aminopeptidase P family protein [Deltaproteobacteria bacterium]|nr:aminopeptidase P family protein [Deltaproteobacteria bacterium]